MPTIPVTDLLGIDVDGKLIEGAALHSFLPVLRDWKDLRLDQVPIESTSLGFSFDRPLDLPAGDLALNIGAGARAGLALIASGKRTIDPDDPFDEIKVAADEMYLGLRLTFTVQGGASLSYFGLNAEQELTLTSYRRFTRTPAGFLSFPEALAAAASKFLLPHSAADLEKLDADQVVTLAGIGTLKLTGSFSPAFPVQSLASVSIGPAKLDVNAGATVKLGAEVTLTGEYRVRLRRESPATVEFGVYRSRSRELRASVSASAGVTAKAGGFELTEQLIGALSRQPTVDREEFRQALPGEDNDAKLKRIEDFETALKAAIDTRLQASVSAAVSSLRSDEAALVFEVSPALAEAPVKAALSGDWTLLSTHPSPQGVVEKQNILTHTDVRKTTLKLNLLGIVNALSISKITQASRIEFNPAGEITLIADTASASRLQAVLFNLAGKDSKRLRRLLNENFLIEAVYHASGAAMLPPDFTSRHVYLEIEAKTDAREMKDALDVARALGTITPQEAGARLGTAKSFGRTTFYVETKYKTEAVRRMFLTDSGTPRTIEDYEVLGRSALAALLSGDETQGFRKRVATDDAIWNEMKRVGNRAAFPPIFGLSAATQNPELEAAGGDYFAITSWAAAMHTAAQAVSETDHLLRGEEVTATDLRLTEARDHLKDRLAKVAGTSDEHFGDPLGLLMVHLAAGQRAALHLVLQGSDIETLDRSQSDTAGRAHA